MLRWFAFPLLLLMLAAPVRAASYGDLWWVAEESGWGVQVVQSGTFQFLTLFIYGPDNKPTWYTAEIFDDGSGNYSGELYANVGPYWANPTWDASKVNQVAVGTASFRPTNAYNATLTWGLTGGPSVTKNVRRQTLLPQTMGGNYSGSLSGTITGCPNPADNDPAVRARYNLTVTQNADVSEVLSFAFVDTGHAGLTCNLSGALEHYGSLYRLVGTMGCSGSGLPFTVPVTVERLHTTQQGIEGFWTATVNGCKQQLRFSAVQN